jgi:CHAD domain-containing protein
VAGASGYRPRVGRSTAVEREVKFEAPIGLALPDLRPDVGQTVRMPEAHLVTTYLDTADRRLWQQGITLRHRTTAGQTEAVGEWTLKLPQPSRGAALERTEVSWPGPEHTVPDEALRILRGVVRREPLRQLVTLRTTRQRLLIRRGRDDVAAELDDDLVLVVGGPRDGVRFRQVELEFHDPSWKGRKVLRSLENAGARVEREAKLAKAIELPPVPGAALEPDHHASMADLLRAAVAAGFDRLVRHDWPLRVASPTPDAEDVHQARVGTRRLRSDLKTFGDLLDPVWLRHVRDDLRWCGAALGQVRDADVLAESLRDAPLPVRRRLAAQRDAAARRLDEVLETDRYLDLLDRLHAASELLPVRAGAASHARRPARKAMPPLVHARWRAVRRAVRRSGANPTPAQLHGIRIKAKQLRYAAEAAAPAIGKPAQQTASAAERVQTVLGDHHDAVAAEAWLRSEWGGNRTETSPPIAVPALSFEAGLLAADARARQRAAQRDWGEAWSGLRRPKSRRWLRQA